MSLKDKVAIITGGGTGIGFGIAQALAGEGVKLVLVQNVRDGLQEAASAVNGTAAVVDISNREMVFSLVQWVEQRLGQIDILVNNASITGKPAVHSFLDTTAEQVQAIVDVNVKGTFYCSQAVARSMVSRGVKGSIIHISSVGAYAAQEHASLYCATKAAISSLAQTMSLELASHGIRVNAIAPGDILTAASADANTGARRYPRVTPLGRRGSPHDIGSAVVFLASEQASFITGTTLVVDGGLLAY
jgi:NAD(P)-dependent dehydrogenase (short-subunit alcohol dehydrogenase family)